MLYSTNNELSIAVHHCEQALNIKGFEHFQHSFQHPGSEKYLLSVNIMQIVALAFAGIEIFT